MTGTVLVTDAGFGRPDPAENFAPAEKIGAGATAPMVDLGPDGDTAALAPHLGAITLIRVGFPAFSDGRGFTLARELRRLGYRGRLRAAGPLISDQYRLARACGFDEVEIPAGLAVRQPEADWRPAGAGDRGYLDRLRGRGAAAGD